MASALRCDDPQAVQFGQAEREPGMIVALIFSVDFDRKGLTVVQLFSIRFEY
jgi:hypothetical protein